jgi:chromosome segregation ATPase
MNENDKSDFKIGIDDEIQDHRFHEEMENIRIEKLSNRITFISVLMLCLIAIIFFLAYLDIKKRVATVHDTGTTEVKNLSKDLEEKLSDLTSKYKQLEDSLSKIENHTSSLQEELNEATTAIKYIRSARKTDNKEFNDSISKIEKKSSSISNDLKNVSSELKTFDTKFNNKLANLSKTADKISVEVNKLKSDISKLSAVKVDKKTLDSALKNEQKLYDQKLNQLERNIGKKIISMPATQVQPKTATESTIIEPGEIIEQDINQ